MKKITLNINGVANTNDAKRMQEALTSLSGVVGAEVSLGMSEAYAYAGDELNASAVVDIAGKSGFSMSVAGAEYLADLSDVKSGFITNGTSVLS